jgi:phosphocarrier protein
MTQPVAEARITVVNKRGLHARAAAKFVKVAGNYDAEITVIANGTEVSGSSIMGLMMLAAAPGCELVVRAVGPAAEEAIGALARLVANRFDED